MDNCADQLEAAAAAVEELGLLSDLAELEPLSDFEESAFFSEEPEVELEDSELLVADPFEELLAASRLSVR